MARSPEALVKWLRGYIEARPDLSGLAARRHEGRELAAQAEERDLSQAERIRLAMGTQSKLAFRYTRKRDGQTGDYVASPYEVGTHPASGAAVLWATETKHGAQQIHAFLMPRISDVDNLTLARYRPRWPVRTETA